MPIRLNLLAEAQAAEDLRRRDPVKRAIWCAGLLVALMLAASSYLQLCNTISHSKLSRVEVQINLQTNAYRGVLDNQKKIADIDQKLTSLRELASARLLYGSFLNAFQKATVDDVQLLHIKTDQGYAITDAIKTKTNEDNVVIKGKPATSTERILVTLEGNDTSANPGDQVPKFKDVLANEAFFKQALPHTNAINLKNLSALQVNPTTGKACVLFALECRFPEKTR